MSRQPPDHVGLDDEALKAVANETRLRIIASLGAVVRDGRYGTRRFSELMEQIGLSDSGQTTYHLDKLREQGYVERTEEGYRLTLRGLRIYQFVRSGVLSGSPAVGPFELDLDHEECGKPLSIRYEDHRVYGECEHCDVVIEGSPLRPSAFDPERPESLREGMRKQMWSENFALTQGYCLYCGGSVDTGFDYPYRGSDVDDATESEPVIRFNCTVCHWFLTTGVEYAGYLHPAVVSFCHRRGIDLREHLMLKVPIEVQRPRIRSEDPWRVTVTYAYEGDSITLTFDDDLTVHEIEREASPIESDASP
ncbi:winged helix-turn-helix domain-containing protein [Halobellus rubicundus]|uniref:Winged helix-turn-helix domain-containing protein n=1 Tax=Halobellus rubicundus TaxID=2996466 RepID=A0ABD5M7P5_9EURY